MAFTNEFAPSRNPLTGFARRLIQVALVIAALGVLVIPVSGITFSIMLTKLVLATVFLLIATALQPS
jgi:hypothetical protein